MKPDDYCELNRRFVPARDDGEDQATLSYEADFTSFALYSWAAKTWADLHKTNSSSVILGEAGSGRSYEFKAQQEKLCEAGTTSFYLELHRLVSDTVEIILDGSTEASKFQKWLRSEEKGYFFLDAVDEAKLEQALDFKKALQNFRRSLGGHLKHAKVYLSSRRSAWIPEIDEDTVRTYLSSAPFEKKARKIGVSEETERTQTVTKVKPQESQTALEVYVICPLKKEAVAKLCTASNLGDVDSFLSALDQSYAWELARRPLDVSLLIRKWKLTGSLGSLGEILDFTASELLNERSEKEDLSRAFPLSPEDARKGAEYLAAASTFCRTLDFSAGDYRRPSPNALDPQQCLPQDWDVNRCNALINRPIFDSAIYGTFRFHHRRIAEYLAANWLKRRMNNFCPLPVLKDLLFDQKDDRLTLWTAVESVATWLACIGESSWVDELREWLLEAKPQVFLRNGDPSRLPSSFKKRIFDSFAGRYKGRKYLHFETDGFALSRLVDDRTVQTLAGLIADPTLGDGPRAKLLTAARESQSTACIPSALNIIEDTSHRRVVANEAIALIGELGTEEDKQRLRDYAIRNEEFAQTHMGQLVQQLFPGALSVEDLRDWFSAATHHERLSTQRYFVKAVFQEEPIDWDPIDVLVMLCDLNEPCLHRNSFEQNPRYWGMWTRELLFPLLRHVLGRKSLSDEQVQIAGKACVIVSMPPSCDEDFGFSEENFNLDALTLSHPQVRREAFWFAIDVELRECVRQSARESGIWAYSETLRFSIGPEGEIWLRQDLKHWDSSINKEVVAWMLFHHWRQSGSNFLGGWRLLRETRKAGVSDQNLRNSIFRTLLHWPPNWFWHAKRRGVLSKWYWRQKGQSIRRWKNTCLDKWRLHKGINTIRTADNCGWLVDLCRLTEQDMKWAVKDWSRLGKKYGRRILEATRDGCVRVWMEYTPDFRLAGNTPNGVIAGLSGLQWLYDEGKLNFESFSPEDARRASLYAVNELNGHSEWLPELSKYRPDEVRTVLLECIEVEWSAVNADNFWCRHLELLADASCPYAHLVVGGVLKFFLERLPDNRGALEAVFKLLITHGQLPSSLFADRASDAIQTIDSNEATYLQWVAILIQLDAGTAMDYLEESLESAETEPANDPRSNLVVRLCVMLQGRRDSFPEVAQPDYLDLEKIERFIRLVYRFVNPCDDIRRPSGATFSPEGRDDAQSFRNSLLSGLAEISDPRAEKILHSLNDDETFSEDSDWMLSLIEKCGGYQANRRAMRPSDLIKFAEVNEYPPSTVRDLFDLTIRQLNGIKYEVEDGDHSGREFVRKGDREVQFRRFVARELNLRNHGLFSCTQESVIANEDRLDIRVENPRYAGHVVIEAKIGNMDRSLKSLLGDLESQLCQRYLRDQGARFGVYLIACTEDYSWKNPYGGPALSFFEIINRLVERANQIKASSSGIEELAVIGIDFRLRED